MADFFYEAGQEVDNSTAPLSELLASHGYRTFGDMVRCPFHEDSSPSAKIYEDSDGERLFCFVCRRQYRATDFIKEVMGIEVKPVGDDNWEPEEIDTSDLEPFKVGELSIEQFCDVLYYLDRDKKVKVKVK